MTPSPALTIASRFEQEEVIRTIKDTVCKGATDPQLRMFLEVCKRTGLDPFLKEIWYVAEKGIIMAARDGYLRVANENPNFDGIETRVERDTKNIPIKAVCTVWRKDRSHPVICEAYYNEYVKQSPVWKQYPSAMISKVAEVLALKRSFAINGVVSEEEVGEHQGSAEAARAVAEAKIAGEMPLIAAPVEVLPPAPKRDIPEELLAVFEAMAKNPKDRSHFNMALDGLRDRLDSAGGHAEGETLVAKFDAIPAKTAAMAKGLLLDLFDAITDAEAKIGATA